MKPALFGVLAALLATTVSRHAQAQCTPHWVAGPGAVGTNGIVYALAVLPSGELIAAGHFTSAGGSAAGQIARYNFTTSAWTSMAGGVTGGGSSADGSFAAALGVIAGGDVIVGGAFSNAGGVAASNIARYRVATNTWSALGSGVADPFFHSVNALAVIPSGDVLVGGFFTAAGGSGAANFARYRPSTSAWVSAGSGVSGSSAHINSLTVLTSGIVVAGGEFTSPGSNIARYNTTTNAWSTLGSGTDFGVLSVAPLSSGEVLVGGFFQFGGGVSLNNVGRASPTSNLWSAYANGLNSDVNAVLALPNGDVVAGGNFSGYIAVYSASTGMWSTLGSGTNGPVYALAILPGGDLLVAGAFSSAGSVSAINIARWSSHPACPADFNCSGGLSVQDIFDFLMAWFNGSSTADFNGGGLSVQDIFDFLGAWFAGCP